MLESEALPGLFVSYDLRLTRDIKNAARFTFEKAGDAWRVKCKRGFLTEQFFPVAEDPGYRPTFTSGNVGVSAWYLKSVGKDEVLIVARKSGRALRAGSLDGRVHLSRNGYGRLASYWELRNAKDVLHTTPFGTHDHIFPRVTPGPPISHFYPEAR